MCILREVSLGAYFFQIAKLLRETLFLSVMLLNGETWINLSKKNIDNLERMDKILIRKVLDLPRSTSLSALFLEMGCVSVREILRAKRLMYTYTE